ncbi:carboxylesterase family protein [Streptococcus merionis]|uniref:Carboxylic ester hydrolase n=1 Tax=Streptococcus merionis TaxID=400065 RepID=A0A239SWF6_9STRE|nr:carboxylesterase family protein [Streptococcus merionis]SNU89821.1 Carboxylesterase type B [Streptococcus merionis]
MKALHYLLGLIGLSVLVACGQESTKPAKTTFNQEVTQTIEAGKVRGQKDNENKAIEWLGIPYAQVTERWTAPKAIDQWSETFDATTYGESALQLSNGEVKGVENALNLDVIRPDTDATDLPVMVFVHGGNNQTGTAQEIKGNTFVNALNAVYVSVNYRLGALGFNPLPALKTGSDAENSGNYTLLDLAAALDWVKANIKSFGGDANNVTLVGFSAGGRDVMATLISPIFKDKYAKAISFSGGMTLADEKESQKIFAKAFASLVVEDKVKANEKEAINWLLSDDAAVADYLHGLKAERLAPLMGSAGIRMSVFPHLYKDGHVLPKTGFDGATFNDVPLLLVTGTSEFSLFTAFDTYFMEDYMAGKLAENESKMSEFLYARNYGGDFYRLSNGVESARMLDGQYTSEIYIGQIAYGENADVTPTLARGLSAFHGVFEPLLQTPSNYATLIGEDFYNDGQVALATAFKGYLKSFIATGKPGDDWSAWIADKQEVLRLDADKSSAKIKMSTDKETAKGVIAKMEADDSLTAEQKKVLNEQVLNGRWFSEPLDNATFNYLTK